MTYKERFIAYLYEQAYRHSIYVWGAQGEGADVISADWIAKKETSTVNRKRVVAKWEAEKELGYGKVLRAYDCSGLGVCFFLANKLIKGDTTANGLKGMCTDVDIKKTKTGDLVFKLDKNGRATHVGYVVDDNGTVIEAKGRDYGVVVSHASAFHVAGTFKKLNETSTEKLPKSRVLKKKLILQKGEDVLVLQLALAFYGYSSGSFDGVFGKKTDKALKAFQSDRGLVVDGKAGKHTYKALHMLWGE